MLFIVICWIFFSLAVFSSRNVYEYLTSTLATNYICRNLWFCFRAILKCSPGHFPILLFFFSFLKQKSYYLKIFFWNVIFIVAICCYLLNLFFLNSIFVSECFRIFTWHMTGELYPQKLLIIFQSLICWLKYTKMCPQFIFEFYCIFFFRFIPKIVSFKDFLLKCNFHRCYFIVICWIFFFLKQYFRLGMFLGV